MKRITPLLGLLAIVLNVAMGYPSTMFFCEHESGDSHLVSRAQHSDAGHEESCHDHSEFLSGEHTDDSACDTCIDTVVSNDDSQEVLRSSSQDRVSAPQIVTVEFVGFDLAESFRPLAVGLHLLARAPPRVVPTSVLVVERTVLII